MDGDARGGAALSIRQVTGQPIKFIGVGENMTRSSPSIPTASSGASSAWATSLRWWKKRRRHVDQKKARGVRHRRRCCGDGFSLEDFRDQLRQIKKLGSIAKRHQDAAHHRPVRRHAKSRRPGGRKAVHARGSHHQLHDAKGADNHEIINGSRRKRIARGSGTSVQEVNQLLRQYAQMRKMFKDMGKGGLAKQMMRGGLARWAWADGRSSGDKVQA